MLFKDEVKDFNELIEKAEDFNLNGNLKVAVICFIFDKDGKLVLERRGPGSRDDIGKLCAIGGAANFSDKDFRSSLEREIKEEAGDNAKVEIQEFLGAISKQSYDKNLSIFTDWIVLAYKGILVDGVIVNKEPELCSEIIWDYMENFNEFELVESAKIFIKEMLNNKLQ